MLRLWPHLEHLLFLIKRKPKKLEFELPCRDKRQSHGSGRSGKPRLKNHDAWRTMVSMRGMTKKNYIYIYIYIYICMCMCMCVYIYIYIHTHTHTIQRHSQGWEWEACHQCKVLTHLLGARSCQYQMGWCQCWICCGVGWCLYYHGEGWSQEGKHLHPFCRCLPCLW